MIKIEKINRWNVLDWLDFKDFDWLDFKYVFFYA